MKSQQPLLSLKISLLALAMLTAVATACGNEDANHAQATDSPAPTSSAPAPHDDHQDDQEQSPITGIDIPEKQLRLAPGEETSLQLTVLPEGADPGALAFASSDSETVSVDAAGLIAAAADAVPGTDVTITVEAEGIAEQVSVSIVPTLEGTLLPAEDGAIPVVANHDSLQVLVNKHRSLPDGYAPSDLVVPDVPFSFSGDSEKKQLRKPAAEALEQLFAQAELDGIELRAVSGYRSYGTQTSIYHYNLQTYGEEHTKRYSAYPGTSEHQTGLAMDVSSPSVDNVLEEVLGDTEEGKWLADNAADFGFIIRYPDGKEHITGYAYEPWHLRYVGVPMAKDIAEAGLTLEEYMGDAVAVDGSVDSGE